jgi:hypothetical protein
MVGQLVVKGLQVGIGPPPPGTLLGVTDDEAAVFDKRFPKNTELITRVSIEIRIVFAISKSPSEVVGGCCLWGMHFPHLRNRLPLVLSPVFSS